MSSLPLVSFVFTVFNGEKFIKASVHAALKQDYKTLEVIVLDDGSSDNTVRECRKIEDPRLKIICSGNVGRARALNAAIRASSGEIIAINDVDDLSLSNRAKLLVRCFQQEQKLGLVGSDYYSTNQFKENLADCLDGESLQLKCTIVSKWSIFKKNCYVHSTIAFPRTVFDQVGGYDETLDICIDYEFIIKVARCFRIGLLQDKTVVMFRDLDSHFRKKSVFRYYRALFHLKKKHRRSLGIPIYGYYYDLLRFPYSMLLRLLT